MDGIDGRMVDPVYRIAENPHMVLILSIILANIHFPPWAGPDMMKELELVARLGAVVCTHVLVWLVQHMYLWNLVCNDPINFLY